MKRLLLLLLATCLGVWPVRAVEVGTSYNLTAPTNTNISGWTSGWSGSGLTGWDYVGYLNTGQSAVYLGNGWAITVGHVGTGFNSVSLDGINYNIVANSFVDITSGSNTVDLQLFQLQTHPNWPLLPIRSSDPKAINGDGTGSPVAIIGFGGGKSWGYDWVNYKNQSEPLGSFVSNDFLLVLGTFLNGSSNITNSAFLVDGDSGGGNFIYNSSASRWELAGINEGVGPSSTNVQFSGMVQLNTYATQINNIVNPVAIDTPTLPMPGLLIMACLLVLVAGHSFKVRVSGCP